MGVIIGPLTTPMERRRVLPRVPKACPLHCCPHENISWLHHKERQQNILIVKNLGFPIQHLFHVWQNTTIK